MARKFMPRLYRRGLLRLEFLRHMRHIFFSFSSPQRTDMSGNCYGG